MGRNNANFHYGHGMGLEPKIGPSMQQLKKPQHSLPLHVGSVMANYHPVEEKSVRISSIKSAQRDVNAKAVRSLAQVPAENIEPIRLWKDSKGLRLFDGNHRIAAALARGETHIRARVWQDPTK